MSGRVSTKADAAHSRERLAAFDGLRAAAALSVLAYHVALAGALSRRGALAPLISELKAGVAVFFVISGCLLYLPYARALRTGARLPDWRAYAHRRVVRIVPAYWVALTVLALGPAAGWVLSANWWRFYGFAQIYNGNTMMGGLGVAWSLCVEVTFYALLPALAVAMAWAMRRRGRSARPRDQLVVLASLTAVSFGLRYALAGSLVAPIPHSGFVVATTLPGFLDWFAAGMALAVVASMWEADERALRPIAWLAVRSNMCWALGAAFFVASALTQHGDLFLPLSGLAAHVAAGIGAALLVLPALAPDTVSAPRGVVRVLRHPVALWLGTISYGIYLWHVPLLERIDGPINPASTTTASPLRIAGLLAVVVVGAGALGAASWYLVERPAKRLLKPRSTAETAVAAA